MRGHKQADSHRNNNKRKVIWRDSGAIGLTQISLIEETHSALDLGAQ